ncbi:leucine-rich repeat-containing protein 23 isoform X1 [Anser cygnoides]|uniref:leucine-rich repeat-containing protein 23 isoform X1 n=1 Tax=Anser cygnoides TaxID=8845 RepID=UPI0034D1C4BE
MGFTTENDRALRLGAASHGNQVGGLLADGWRGKEPSVARFAQRGTAALCVQLREAGRGFQGALARTLGGKYGKTGENTGKSGPRPGAAGQHGCYGGGAGPAPGSHGSAAAAARRRGSRCGLASSGWEAGAVRMEEEELSEEEHLRQEEEEEALSEQEEEEQALVPCPLTEEMLKEGLSLLCKTGNGLAHAYVKFEAKYKDLTDISLLECFIHLRYVDLSENKLQDLSPLSSLTHLLWLKVDGNLLTSARMQELPYLQIISFAHNHIKDMEGITHPCLANLSLKGNKIRTALGLSQALFSLHNLELRGNKLESTAGFNLPKLKNLYLAQNAIRSLEGLEALEQLTTLHLRDNQLETLDGFCSSMKCLRYLNLRNNGISTFQEVAKLQVLPMLQALVLLDNPCSDEPNYRLEVLVLLPRLERLDKESFEQDERAEANEIRQKRQEEEKETEGSLQGDMTE